MLGYLSAWLHTRACKYNFSVVGTYFDFDGVKRTCLTYVDFT